MATYILSPHFDDAAVNCYSVLSKSGVSVITVFGAAPTNLKTTTLWDIICGVPNSHKMMLQRSAENKQALSGYRVKLIDLDFLDNQYRKNSLSKKDIARTLDAVIPNQATIFVPLALSRLYRHPDHIMVREAALTLTKNRSIILYPDMPYMKLSSDVEKESAKIMRLAEKVLNLELTPVVNHLTQKDVISKIKLINSYTTQYAMTNLVSFGGLTSIRKLSYEIFFKLS